MQWLFSLYFDQIFDATRVDSRTFCGSILSRAVCHRHIPLAPKIQSYQVQKNKTPDGESVASADGSSVPLSQLVSAVSRISIASINHIDYQQALTLQAELDKTQMDTLAANRLIQHRWQQVKNRYPDIKVHFSGEMEAVKEGLNQLW